MRVDFYQLSRDPAEAAVTMLADKVLQAGQRLLVVADDPALSERISRALWSAADSFLAHGAAGGEHDADQPILLSGAVAPDPANGAQCVLLADGVWRDMAGSFPRVLLLFDGTTVESSREIWRRLGQREGVERNFWRQEEGRWIKAA